MVRLRLFGVTAEQPSREISLMASAYIQPFDPSRLNRALMRLQQRPDRELLFRQAIKDCSNRYERLRREGRHDGPPLAGLRLYEVTWRFDPELRNINRPDERILLNED